MKTLLYLLTGLVALALIGFFVITFFLGGIIKGGVNRYGPQIAKAKVELAEAKVSPLSGSGTLTNLVIGNPTGWQSDHAFSLGKIQLEMEPRSLMSDHIVINSLIIDQPDIIYETKITNSNLQDLLKNVQESSRSAEQQPANAPATKEGKPIKIEIKTFRLLNGKITVIGAGQNLSTPMPTVALDNLGTKEGGLTSPELAAAVMKEITGQAVVAAGKIAVEKGLLNKASEGLENLLGGKKK